MAQWIDFKELRSKLKFIDVLNYYHVELKVKGDRAYALCPLPEHPTRCDGRKRTASFSANLAKGIFQCFGCRASGNLVEFSCLMDGLNPSDPAQFRQGALRLGHVFGLFTTGSKGTSKKTAGSFQLEPGTFSAGPNQNVVVNAPLNFELKNLDPDHAYLRSRGLTPETISNFGLGFCSRGMLTDRIAIPLHNAAGELIGYAGRLVNEDRIDDENPKYLFPGTRERDGTTYQFRKSEFLYNRHLLKLPTSDLIVVEGFASVWWLWQLGFHHVVGLMGSSCSATQGALLSDSVREDGRVWLLPDADDAGGHCAKSLFEHLGPRRFVRWLQLPGKRQPTDMSVDELDTLLPKTPAR